jgi:hypothetical protein
VCSLNFCFCSSSSSETSTELLDSVSFVKLEEEADEGADEEAEEKDEEDVSWGGSGMSIVTSPGVGSGGRISSDFRGRTVDLDKGLRISA